MGEGAKGIAPGSAVVTPHLVVRDCAGAIEFYKKAFGAEEVLRMPLPDGSKLLHAEVRIQGAVVMLVDEFPEWGSTSPESLGGTPVTLNLHVTDVDAAVERAGAAGCQVVMPPADMFWGDRYAKLLDPYGHSWSLAQHLRDPSPEELEAGMKAALAAMAK